LIYINGDYMKKYKLISRLIIGLLLLQAFNLTIFANSSWVWISETRPYDVLPWVAVGTLMIETVSIIVFAKIKNGFKVFTFVTIANAISFAAPYLINLMLYSDQMFSFDKYLEHWPSYMVGFLFCIATVLIELPIVYFSLSKYASSIKRFVITVICSNIVTTVLVAITERIFCVGRW